MPANSADRHAQLGFGFAKGARPGLEEPARARYNAAVIGTAQRVERMVNYLVTGASGFVGSALTERLLREPEAHVAASSRGSGRPPSDRLLPVISAVHDGDWRRQLANVDVVIHCAGLTPAHGSETKRALLQANRDATVNLAAQAATSGVRRFVFVSSAQIHGAVTQGRPIDEKSAADPRSPYAESKWEAEQQLRTLAAETGLSVTIVRPPLVYGRGAKGNLAQLAKLAGLGLPLPLAGIGNRRSLVAVDNLTDFLVRCANRPEAGGETYLLSDGRDLSTTDIVRFLAGKAGPAPRLFRMPIGLMRTPLTWMGRSGMAESLFGSFEIDSAKARETGWVPSVTPDTAVWR